MKGAQEIWLLKALRIQTSPGALQSTRQGTNSQKCEAVNHDFCMANPKNSLTFHRNRKNCDAQHTYLEQWSWYIYCKKTESCWDPHVNQFSCSPTSDATEQTTKVQPASKAI